MFTATPRTTTTNTDNNNNGNRVVFKWLSKAITWLRLLRLVIGFKDSRQFFNQWEAKPKPKPIAPCTRDFSRASSELQKLLGTVIGSWRYLFLLWLVGAIVLVLVFRQSFENRSNNNNNNDIDKYFLRIDVTICSLGVVVLDRRLAPWALPFGLAKQ